MLVFIALCAVYMASYIHFYRWAFEHSDDYGINTRFYFVVPETLAHSIANKICIGFYFPTIVIDNLEGSGRWPAYDDEVHQEP